MSIEERCKNFIRECTAEYSHGSLKRIAIRYQEMRAEEGRKITLPSAKVAIFQSKKRLENGKPIDPKIISLFSQEREYQREMLV